MATYVELQQQIQALQKEAEALKANERQGVIERMREAIAVYDITAEDLGLSGSGHRSAKGAAQRATSRKSKQEGASASAPYGDGKGNTWAGRGPRPRWLKEALDAGAKLEEFAR